MFVLALVVRLLFFAAVRPWDPAVVRDEILIEDAAGFRQLAHGLVRDHSFAVFDAGEYIKTPGYPLFLASVWTVFGERVWVALLFQAVLSASVVFVVAAIAKDLARSRWTPLIAAFLYAICVPSSFIATRILAESMFTLIFAISIWILIRAFDDPRFVRCVLAGLLLGLATLVKPILTYYPVLVFIAFLTAKGSFLLRMRGAVVVIIIFCVVISPWQARNYERYGHYSMSNMGGMNLWEKQAGYLKAYVEGVSIAAARADLAAPLVGITNPFELAEKGRRIGIRYVTAHPREYLVLCARAAGAMFFSTERGEVARIFIGKREAKRGDMPEGIASRIKYSLKEARQQYFIGPLLAIIVLAEYAFALVGLAVMWRTRHRAAAVLFATTIIYMTVLPGVTGILRYRIPFIPLYLVLAAIGLSSSIDRVRKAS
jgi:4-amino-4-deoxy-L-arabinose transferase-like glycosyltransferase